MSRVRVGGGAVLAFWVCALCVSAGCATSDGLQIPSAEIERLLEQPPSAVGLTADQSSAMRSMIESAASERRTLDLHLAEEKRQLQKMLADPRAMQSPEVWAQISLVSQLRTDRLLMAALLRKGLWERLTREQQIWWVKNRLNVMIPMD